MMRIRETKVELRWKNQQLSQQGPAMFNTLLYTALADTVDHLPVHQFRLLLTLQPLQDRIRLGVISYIEPFVFALHELFSLLLSGRSEEVGSRVATAALRVHHTKASLSLGERLPYMISLTENTCVLEPVKYRVVVPFSTGDILVALAAAANGCVLNIDHGTGLNYRDRLFLEYMERIRLGSPFSFYDFECNDQHPESWNLAPKNHEK